MKPASAGPLEVAPQDLPGIALEGRPVEVQDVAEHARLGRLGVGPRQHLERVRVRLGEHVALLDPGEPVDRRAIERHAFGEGVLQLDGRDGEALQLPEHVGEPQPHQAHAALFDRTQHVIPLSLHAASLAARSTTVRAGGSANEAGGADDRAVSTDIVEAGSAASRESTPSLQFPRDLREVPTRAVPELVVATPVHDATPHGSDQ